MKKAMILICALLLLCVFCVGCGAGGGKGTPEPESAAKTQPSAPIEVGTENEQTDTNKEETPVSDMVKATITMQDGGVMELELYPDIAPQSVYNFAYLAREGFYDGLIFHRVIENFMIQGGDPDGTGMGGPGYAIKGEFAVNGVENNLKHTRGVISMARQGDPFYDSAGSQFFIMHQDVPNLDGSYAAFGKVTSGLEVVDTIASTPTDASDRPIEDVVIKSIVIDAPELPEPERLEE